jgi:hypothetical protein
LKIRIPINENSLLILKVNRFLSVGLIWCVWIRALLLFDRASRCIVIILSSWMRLMQFLILFSLLQKGGC